MQNNYDVIIIGAGVVGSSVARELSRYKVRVGVLEKEADVCCGNSSRNTGLLHAGFYPAGSLKAKFTVEGNQAFDAIARELDIPFKRTGKLIVGFTEEERERLIALKRLGEENGVPGLKMIDREGIDKINPNVGGNFALYSETTGITCPYLYTIALAENAKINGVDYYFESEVTGVERKADGRFSIITPKGKFSAKWIINSAGLYSTKVAEMLGSPGHKLRLVRGEYIILDKKAKDYVNIPVYPCPDERGIFDIHITPTVDGNALIGPTCDEVIEHPDFDTTRTGLSALVNYGSKLFKQMRSDWYIRNFAGIFPRLIDPQTGLEKDFVIEYKKERPNIINLLGMNSPGLTCAYPIARRVASIVAEEEVLQKNDQFNPFRKSIVHFAELSDEVRQELIRENPDYGEIVCRCEYVTKAEILQALHNPLGVSSLNSIKYRTRATMGRCQGGYCEMRISSILQEDGGLKKTDIRLDNGLSYMFTGEVRTCR